MMNYIKKLDTIKGITELEKTIIRLEREEFESYIEEELYFQVKLFIETLDNKMLDLIQIKRTDKYLDGNSSSEIIEVINKDIKNELDRIVFKRIAVYKEILGLGINYTKELTKKDQEHTVYTPDLHLGKHKFIERLREKAISIQNEDC